MKRLIKNALHRLGLDLIRYRPDPFTGLESLIDLSEDELKIVSTVRPFTATSPERLAALLHAISYLTTNKIEGDIVECGVWRGGSMMATALTLLSRGDTNRSLYLYDTFEGMPPPTVVDKTPDGASAESQLASEPKGTGIWCYASLDEVRTNIISTGYPKDRIHLIKGKVEETIPQTLPARVALLRLDTDWYESTRHELTHLFPLLDPRGVLIIDDYGHWEGARKAVDEYFALHRPGIYLHRIDYTGRIAVGAGALHA
jgi:hypothetical protein